MATYRLIGGTFIHGYDAEGNTRIWRARNLPRVEPGGPVAGGGPPDPLWKEGDDIVKTNKLFRVVNKHKVSHVTLDVLHPGKFQVVDTEDCKPEEDVYLTGYRRHSNHVSNPDGVMYVPAAQAARQQPKPIISRPEATADPKPPEANGGQQKPPEAKPQPQQQRKPETAGAAR